MLRLGGFASPSYIAVFRGLQTLFRRQGIDLDWVLYSTWDALVDAFVKGEVDLAWNGPLAYVKIRRRVEQPCRVVAMRDVDVDLVTHFITRPDSGISTPIDLKGKRFAFGGRGSVETGLLAHHFLKQEGVDPERDLAASTFYEERKPIVLSGERDVIERVRQGEYDAGAVSGPTLAALEAEGALPAGSTLTFWSSPGYSHCCFTAQGSLGEDLLQRITDAFVSADLGDPIGGDVLTREHCLAFVPGITEGWDILEEAAEKQNLI